jgi:hypothetical protein
MSLLHKFSYLNRTFTCHAHKISPVGQVGDVQYRFWFGELAGDEVLTAQVKDGELSFG